MNKSNTFFSVSLLLVPPLFVIEFLHRVVDTITDYFSSCTELTIKENSVVVFEVMNDYRYPSKFDTDIC